MLEVGEFVHRHGQWIEDVVHEFDVDRAQAEAAREYYEDYPELMETLRAQHEARRRAMREQSRLRE